jgi:hypothetical protein
MRFSAPRLRLGMRVSTAVFALALLALGAASTAVASSTLTSYTWSGTTPTSMAGASNWSNGTNWSGGVAPAGSVGRLTFPALTSSACTSSPPTDTCYGTFNNITGLIAHAVSIDDAVGYLMPGNLLKLGSGGLTASTTSTTFTGVPELSMPLALTAAQTWTIDGHNIDAQLGVTNVTGPTRALTLDLNHSTFLGVGSGSVEVGPLTIGTTQTTGFNPSAVALSTGGRLNATDGNSVSITAGAETGLFITGNAAVGALTADTGTIQVGNGSSGAAKLAVSGAFTQGSSNGLVLNVVNAGTVAGTDYSQLRATGAISLAGTLQLNGSTTGTSPTCPTLHAGDVDRLLSTTGALTGTFAGIPNGAVVTVRCSPGTQPTGRIHYTSNGVNFTVLTAGGPSKAAPNPGSTGAAPTPPTWSTSGLTSEGGAG